MGCFSFESVNHVGILIDWIGLTTVLLSVRESNMETICRVCLCWYALKVLSRPIRNKTFKCPQCRNAYQANTPSQRLMWLRRTLSRVADFEETDNYWDGMASPDGFPVGVTNTNTQYHFYRRRLSKSELAERLEYEQRHDPSCHLAPFRRPLPNIPLSD